MANHAGLLECLAVTLRGEHTGLEVKMYCSATLRRMAELIRHPMIAQGALLSALVKAATWTNTDCIAQVSERIAFMRILCMRVILCVTTKCDAFALIATVRRSVPKQPSRKIA